MFEDFAGIEIGLAAGIVTECEDGVVDIEVTAGTSLAEVDEAAKTLEKGLTAG